MVFLGLFTLEVELVQLFPQWFQISIGIDIFETGEFFFLALYPLTDTIESQLQMLNTGLFTSAVRRASLAFWLKVSQRCCQLCIVSSASHGQ